MSFTKQIREYSIKNPNTILDVSKVKDTVFSEIPYKTLFPYAHVFPTFPRSKVCKRLFQTLAERFLGMNF